MLVWRQARYLARWYPIRQFPRIKFNWLNSDQECRAPDASEPPPPYSYVPGGPWPYPRSSPKGHSFGRREPKLAPAAESSGPVWSGFLRGVELFNAGYYWEAHDVWEAVWHAFGRHGAAADAVKALIKLAAAGVKVREGHEHGVRIHAARAAALFRAVSAEAGRINSGSTWTSWPAARTKSRKSRCGNVDPRMRRLCECLGSRLSAKGLAPGSRAAILERIARTG